MKLPKHKHVSLIVVTTLRIHNQCFEAAVHDNLCSFKLKKRWAVGKKEFPVLAGCAAN